jgi:hypothetical protein
LTLKDVLRNQVLSCHAETGSASHLLDPLGEIPDQVRDDRSNFQKPILDKSEIQSRIDFGHLKLESGTYLGFGICDLKF